MRSAPRGTWKPVAVAVAAALLMVGGGCGKEPRPIVVIYTALDRAFSEPILKTFEQRTGIRVLAKYDTESTKTVGLVNAIRAEKARPRCDVFWNNEIVNTIRLKEEGLLEPYHAQAAGEFPSRFRDPGGHWCGFAARARVLIVNTNLVPAEAVPHSIYALADPRWKGRIGMAKPLFGTTATQAACLFAALGEAKARQFFESLRANAVQIQSGNKTVALNVSAGQLAFGLTDTDDAIGEVEDGKPVMIVYPDSDPGELGVLFIPNTLALLKNAPHLDAGKKLIEFLLSPEVEGALADAKSAQIPLNPGVKVKPRVLTPAEVTSMNVDFSKAAACFSQASACVEDLFLAR